MDGEARTRDVDADEPNDDEEAEDKEEEDEGEMEEAVEEDNAPVSSVELLVRCAVCCARGRG